MIFLNKETLTLKATENVSNIFSSTFIIVNYFLTYLVIYTLTFFLAIVPCIRSCKIITSFKSMLCSAVL